MLTGLAYIGHTVVIFDGDIAAIPFACAGADVLIVDSVMLQFLQPGSSYVLSSLQTCYQCSNSLISLNHSIQLSTMTIRFDLI